MPEKKKTQTLLYELWQQYAKMENPTVSVLKKECGATKLHIAIYIKHMPYDCLKAYGSDVHIPFGSAR